MGYRKIIYSGINGPLGHALGQLTKSDERFIPFSSEECDLRDANSTRTYFVNAIDRINPSEVAYLHLAARSGGVRFSALQPATAFVDNMQMAINALKVCEEIGIKRILLTLSTSCYSENLEMPSEAQLHEGSIDSSDFSYAYAKRMQEVLMRSFNKEFGMQISSVLVNGIIGPKMSFNQENSILPASLIRDFAKEVKSTKVIDVVFDPDVRREYTYSMDLAKILLWCLAKQESNSLLNIGSTEAVSVREIAHCVSNSLGIPQSRINYIEKKSSGRLVQSTSNEKFLIQNAFQYTHFSYAIKEAVDWYLIHQTKSLSK
jgi:GDP-L-fucose synthase